MAITSYKKQEADPKKGFTNFIVGRFVSDGSWPDFDQMRIVGHAFGRGDRSFVEECYSNAHRVVHELGGDDAALRFAMSRCGRGGFIGFDFIGEVERLNRSKQEHDRILAENEAKSRERKAARKRMLISFVKRIRTAFSNFERVTRPDKQAGPGVE